jgi:tight adherence protein C
VEQLRRRLLLAGSPAAWPLERVLAVKLLLGLGTLVLTGVWVASTSSGGIGGSIGRFAAALVVSVLAYIAPDLLIANRGRRRQQEIQTRLPDMLDQVTISVEAGLGFEAALQRAARSGSGPQAEELQRTLTEISIGIPRKQAFLNMAHRTDVPELRHFVFAINQAEDYGLPIAQVLRVQARELRTLRRQRAEERAMKIPVKIVLPLALCILPSLFVVILLPALIRIFETLL